jgi:peptidoglycan/LPS O-acetylase OafA/YrhL
VVLKARADVDAQRFTPGGALANFYRRRALRILPLYYAVLALTLFLQVPGAQGYFWGNALYLTNVRAFASEAWPGSFAHLWSLAVEQQFYLLWPPVLLLAPRKWLAPLAVAACLSAPAFKIVATTAGAHPLFVRFLTPACLDALGTGALLALCGEGLRRRLAGYALTAGLPLLMLAVLIRSDGLLARTLTDCAVCLCAAWLVSSAADGFKAARPLLEFRPLLWVGRVSYGIYLFHFFMPYFFPSLAPSRGGRLVLAALSVGMAGLSYAFWERPFLRLKDGLPRRLKVNERLHRPLTP